MPKNGSGRSFCSLCGKTIKTVNLARHNTTECSNRIVTCLVCNKETVCKYLLTKHTMNCDEFINKCRFCSQSTTAKNMSNHLMICTGVDRRMALLVLDINIPNIAYRLCMKDLRGMKRSYFSNISFEESKLLQNNSDYWKYRLLVCASQFTDDVIILIMEGVFKRISNQFIELYEIMMKRRMTRNVLYAICKVNKVTGTYSIEWHEKWHIYSTQVSMDNQIFLFEFISKRNSGQELAERYYRRIKEMLSYCLNENVTGIVLKYAFSWSKSHFTTRLPDVHEYHKHAEDHDDKRATIATHISTETSQKEN